MSAEPVVYTDDDDDEVVCSGHDDGFVAAMRCPACSTMPRVFASPRLTGR